jgi:hypothetical protein
LRTASIAWLAAPLVFCSKEAEEKRALQATATKYLEQFYEVRWYRLCPHVPFLTHAADSPWPASLSQAEGAGVFVRASPAQVSCLTPILHLKQFLASSLLQRRNRSKEERIKLVREAAEGRGAPL